MNKSSLIQPSSPRTSNTEPVSIIEEEPWLHFAQEMNYLKDSKTQAPGITMSSPQVDNTGKQGIQNIEEHYIKTVGKTENNGSCSSSFINENKSLKQVTKEKKEQNIMDTKYPKFEVCKEEMIQDLKKIVSLDLKIQTEPRRSERFKKMFSNNKSGPVYTELNEEKIKKRVPQKTTQLKKKSINKISSAQSIASDKNKRSPKFKSTQVTPNQQVIFPSAIIKIDKNTKKKIVLLPKKINTENPPYISGLVDIQKTINISNLPHQNNPTLPDTVPDSSRTSNSQPHDVPPHPSEPIPIALPLLPSEILDAMDQIWIQKPNCNGMHHVNIYNETTSLPMPKLSIQPNISSAEPSLILSWTTNTNSQVNSIKAYEVFSCEPVSKIPNNKADVWKRIGVINHKPGIMTCNLTGVFLKGKMFFYIVRAKNYQDKNGPFSGAVSFKYI